LVSKAASALKLLGEQIKITPSKKRDLGYFPFEYLPWACPNEGRPWAD
jgi:hypothetical protein